MDRETLTGREPGSTDSEACHLPSLLWSYETTKCCSSIWISFSPACSLLCFGLWGYVQSQNILVFACCWTISTPLTLPMTCSNNAVFVEPSWMSRECCAILFSRYRIVSPYYTPLVTTFHPVHQPGLHNRALRIGVQGTQYDHIAEGHFCARALAANEVSYSYWHLNFWPKTTYRPALLNVLKFKKVK